MKRDSNGRIVIPLWMKIMDVFIFLSLLPFFVYIIINVLAFGMGYPGYEGS